MLNNKLIFLKFNDAQTILQAPCCPSLFSPVYSKISGRFLAAVVRHAIQHLWFFFNHFAILLSSRMSENIATVERLVISVLKQILLVLYNIDLHTHFSLEMVSL